MSQYDVVKCPLCGRNLEREYLKHPLEPYTNKLRRDMGESHYYCYPCEHYITLIHYLDEQDAITMKIREMRQRL